LARHVIAPSLVVLCLVVPCLVLAFGALSGCSEPVTPSGAIKFYRKTPPSKPGHTLSQSMMCSCTRCEPASCCRELEQDTPSNNEKCGDGYDFSKCGGIAVSSCGSRCFEHRWRADVNEGCNSKRPRECCHDS